MAGEDRKFCRPALVWLVMCLAACTVHKGPPPSTDIDETLYRDGLRILASDDFQGRKPGTAGGEKTAAYLADEFRKLGLKPGNGSSYLQMVPLVEITAGADASLRVSGPGGITPLAYGKDMVIWSKRPLPEAALQRSELVFVGFGIVAPEYAWDDYANVDVRGKTVLVLVNDPGYGSRDPAVFRGNAMSRYGRWEYKLEQAGRHGAAGALLVHDARALGYPWAAVLAARQGAQLESPDPDGHSGRPLIEGWVDDAAARALFVAAGRDFAAEVAAAAHPGFKAIPLGMKVDAMLHNNVRELSAANVVGLLPGAGRGKEYVAYVAHWDQLGMDTSRTGRNIYSGAVEDASGTAGLLALAQSFVRTTPRVDRSIVFLAVTGGESGLLGANFYCDHPLYPLRVTAAVIDVDGLLDGGHTRDLSIYGYGNSSLDEVAGEEALLQGREAHPDPTPQWGFFYRSDSYAFAMHGVPVLFAQSGIDDAARGPAFGRQQREAYFAERYLRPTDQYSPDWNVVGALDDLTLYYQVGNRLATSRRFPRWNPSSEFRAAKRSSIPDGE